MKASVYIIISVMKKEALKTRGLATDWIHSLSRFTCWSFACWLFVISYYCHIYLCSYFRIPCSVKHHILTAWVNEWMEVLNTKNVQPSEWTMLHVKWIMYLAGFSPSLRSTSAACVRAAGAAGGAASTRHQLSPSRVILEYMNSLHSSFAWRTNSLSVGICSNASITPEDVHNLSVLQLSESILCLFSHQQLDF